MDDRRRLGESATSPPTVAAGGGMVPSSLADPTRCEVCGAVGQSRIYPVVGVARCRRCRVASLVEPPSESDVAAMYSDASDYDNYLADQRTTALDRRYTAVLDRLDELLPSASGDRVLYDVGAGGGAFLRRAQQRGYVVTGNDVSSRARAVCADRTKVVLSDRLLEDEPGSDRVDVITMWCVLAHVANARSLLQAAHRLLRPGGLLYFHTPRWCAIDAAALLLSRVSGGRLSQITHRRICGAHMRLYDARNLRSVLESVEFDVLALDAKASYSMTTTSYLRDLGIPSPLRGVSSGILDIFVRRSWFPRNILDVVARKPMVASAERADGSWP